MLHRGRSPRLLLLAAFLACVARGAEESRGSSATPGGQPPAVLAARPRILFTGKRIEAIALSGSDPPLLSKTDPPTAVVRWT